MTSRQHEEHINENKKGSKSGEECSENDNRTLGFPTALLRPPLAALVLLTCRPGGARGCALPRNQAQLSRDNLVLLGQMRRLSPFFCLRDRRDFGFPRNLLEGGRLQQAQAAAVLQQLLQQIFNLLLAERAPAPWSPALLAGLGAGLHLYFQDIRLYLQEKGHSDCAWEIVRLEIMRSLSSTVTLQDRIGIKDGDLGSP
ncbi:interferon omega-1-like [Suricata suricatta]|uniref:interferon omega-1-like n=1 Tax=Suricata suricatta TaxID=37032 RepID=UPI001155FF09|nr:interferon omega-1-like [Suricata suricatta]